MIMTNPDKPITKQDLSDFYSKIQPYLGGMPEIYANKFAKGDLYDTNEKIIGCWIDGKPLYQKTIFCETLPNNTNKNFNHGISNLEMAIISDSVIYNKNAIEFHTVDYSTPTGTNYGVEVSVFNTYIEINTKVDRSNWNAYITLKYTKSSDSANSFNFGNTTDYSTDEKIIGTWLDGSYIYQKTIDFGLLPNNSSKSVAHGISNLKRVINYSAIMQNTSSIDGRPIPIYAEGSNNFVSVEYNDSVIKVYASNDRRNFYSYVTLQYTKTI